METIKELEGQEISTVKEDASGIPGTTQKKKRLLEVFDGRNWPVKSCGSVFVGELETTKEVTKKIITKASAGDEHKKRSSKYTLAVGSSFGHVHAFMKDTDNVLTTLDRNGAEDKCLMLIRKPKSASKQMLKAHSWANLSFPEPHLLDGTFKGDTLRHQKHRGKRKPFDFNSGSCRGSDVGTPTYSSVSEGLSTVREQKEYPQQVNSMSNSGECSPPESLQESHSVLKSKPDLQIHQNFEVNNKKKNLAKFFSAKKKNNDVLESRNKNRKTEKYSQTLEKSDVGSVPARQNDSAVKNDSVVKNYNGRIGNDEFYESGFRSEASMQKSQKLDSSCRSSTERPKVANTNWCEAKKSSVRQHVSSKSHKSRTVEFNKKPNSGFQPNYVESDRSVFEENVEGDPVSRSHSLADLTSGLTFSLVGQKKADSVQHLPTNISYMDKPNNQRDLVGNIPKNNENSCNNKRFMSLQNLSPCINNLDEKQIFIVKPDEKRPRKLPEVPYGVDISEKRRQVSDFMKMRMTLSSRASFSPGSISTSNNSSSGQGGVSTTPSDREVSALLAPDKTLQNNVSSSLDLRNLNLMDENQVAQKRTPLSHSLRSSGSFSSQDHSMSCFSRVPSTGMSESGLTTLTSQSTVDSGYITNDAESDVLSTSNYARSIKQSAQNFYTSNKYFKSSVHHNSKPSADTRTWLEKQVAHQPNMENRASNTLPKMTSYSRTDNACSVNTLGAEANSESLAKKKDKVSTFKDTQLQTSNLHRKGISNSMSFGLNISGFSSGFKLSNFQNCPVGSLQDLSKHQPFVCNGHLNKENESSEAGPLSKTWPEGLKFSSNNGQLNYTRLLRKPSLFQILQIYELCPVRLKLSDNVALFDLIKLIECEIMLPSPWSENKHSDQTVSSPKGNHAKLGGPGSAFKPVKSGSSLAPITMITVVQISSKLADCCTEGNIVKGDLIVEVNEQLVIGTQLKTLEGFLKPFQGELLLIIARDRARKFNPPQGAPSPNEDVKNLEEKISWMEIELRKKERTLKQLNALLPWTLSSDGKPADQNEVNDSYINSLSEDEYIV